MRRRSFARSVVVTFSLAELACTGATEDHVKHSNPPPPADEGAAPADDGTPETPETPQTPDPPDPPDTVIPEPKTEISRRPDGTCWEMIVIDCPPGIACNPPPPKQVDCPQDGPKEPDDGLPDATVAANIDQHDDGTCWESFTVECPEGAICNPPPPRQVKCPPGRVP